MTAAIPTHRCHAQGCDTRSDAFMSAIHWPLVPLPLREALQGISGLDGLADEVKAMAEAAIKEVAHKERRSAPRAPRAPRKPVQLSLFELDSA